MEAGTAGTDECPVCYENLPPKSTVTTTCGQRLQRGRHVVCEACYGTLDNRRQPQRRCPLCRERFPPRKGTFYGFDLVDEYTTFRPTGVELKESFRDIGRGDQFLMFGVRGDGYQLMNTYSEWGPEASSASGATATATAPLTGRLFMRSRGNPDPPGFAVWDDLPDDEKEAILAQGWEVFVGTATVKGDDEMYEDMLESDMLESQDP